MTSLGRKGFVGGKVMLESFWWREDALGIHRLHLNTSYVFAPLGSTWCEYIEAGSIVCLHVELRIVWTCLDPCIWRALAVATPLDGAEHWA